MILNQVIQGLNFEKDEKAKDHFRSSPHAEGGQWGGPSLLLLPAGGALPRRAPGRVSLHCVYAGPFSWTEVTQGLWEHFGNVYEIQQSPAENIYLWTTHIGRLEHFRNSLFFLDHAIGSKEPAKSRQISKLKSRWTGGGLQVMVEFSWQPRVCFPLRSAE